MVLFVTVYCGFEGPVRKRTERSGSDVRDGLCVYQWYVGCVGEVQGTCQIFRATEKRHEDVNDRRPFSPLLHKSKETDGTDGSDRVGQEIPGNPITRIFEDVSLSITLKVSVPLTQ